MKSTYKKSWSKANHEKVKNRVRENTLKRNYGITSREYDLMLEMQEGKCWICGTTPKTRRLAVDHKHQPKEKQLRNKGYQVEIRKNIRGLLCFQCNTSLKRSKDNIDWMRKALDYLEKCPAQEVFNEKIL